MTGALVYLQYIPQVQFIEPTNIDQFNGLNLQNLALNLKAAEIQSGAKIQIDCRVNNPNDVLKDTYLVVHDHVALNFHMCTVAQKVEFFKIVIKNNNLELKITNDEILKQRLLMTIKHTQSWLDKALTEDQTTLWGNSGYHYTDYTYKFPS